MRAPTMTHRLAAELLGTFWLVLADSPALAAASAVLSVHYRYRRGTKAYGRVVVTTAAIVSGAAALCAKNSRS